MLDELVFKGKNLDEALSKASNFFGADREQLSYEFLDESPDGEVWIKLKEHPFASGKPPAPAAEESQPDEQLDEQPDEQPDEQLDEQLDEQPPTSYSPPPPTQSVPPTRPGRQPYPPYQQRGAGGAGAGARARRSWGDDRPPQRGRGEGGGRGRGKEHWKAREPQLDGLGQAEKDAHAFVAGLLGKMRMRLDVLPVQDQSRLIFNIDGPDRNILLAKKGSVLSAVQYLVNKIFMNRSERPQKIFVDSNGYRIAREEELGEIAKMSADKVRASGREYVLNPMDPYERRLIHIALKDDDEVATISRGEGFIKRVAIVPRGADGEAPPEDGEGK